MKNRALSLLGVPRFKSPLNQLINARFFTDSNLIRSRVEISDAEVDVPDETFLQAGPRSMLYFEPKVTNAAVVTCGGLSPGLNNVIRSLTGELLLNYKVNSVRGYRYGFSGFDPRGDDPVELTMENITDIHQLGGTILGSSRGPVEPAVIVDRLVRDNVKLLFCIGGDGTQRAIGKIYEEIKKRSLELSIIGIPKTIDNDVPYVWQSFGFLTAVEKAREVILSAGREARSYKNGVSIVKLMGRNAGFISTMATLASQEVDFCLIPEERFKLDGDGGLLDGIAIRLKEKGSCIVVAAEGAGQELFPESKVKADKSGNKSLGDIGMFLKERITAFTSEKKLSENVRYFDPSYSIRAVPANVGDAFLCDQLARAAVHAALAGFTNTMIGQWYNNLIYVPLELVNGAKKRVNPAGHTWQNVLSVTRQREVLNA